MKFRDFFKKLKFPGRRHILGMEVYLSHEGDHVVVTAYSKINDAFYDLSKAVQQSVLEDCIKYFQDKREELRCGQKL